MEKVHFPYPKGYRKYEGLLRTASKDVRDHLSIQHRKGKERTRAPNPVYNPENRPYFYNIGHLHKYANFAVDGVPFDWEAAFGDTVTSGSPQRVVRMIGEKVGKHCAFIEFVEIYPGPKADDPDMTEDFHYLYMLNKHTGKMGAYRVSKDGKKFVGTGPRPGFKKGQPRPKFETQPVCAWGEAPTPVPARALFASVPKESEAPPLPPRRERAKKIQTGGQRPPSKLGKNVGWIDV